MLEAFVFGKFHPFHSGHEAMINFALGYCDKLYVLICASNNEPIPGDTRQGWIKETYKYEKCIEVIIYEYDENELSNSSKASKSVSLAWSKVFSLILPRCELLITSEPYGPWVANYMGIQHIEFDLNRSNTPISSSVISSNPSKYWHYIPKSVRPFYAIKVVILGTESTGKSTLAQKLSEHYSCSLVHEAGRSIIENSQSFSLEDLETVAKVHSMYIRDAEKGPSRLIIIDTDIHITLSYGNHFFGEYLRVSEAIFETHHSNLYLYLNADIPFVQDGTRLTEEQRNELDRSHRTTLNQFNISYTELNGNWNDRFSEAIKTIDLLLAGLE